MSATLYPGIKSLHLVLTTPYDTIRTSDLRDDLIGVKVWVSKVSGFTPGGSNSTLAFDGLSLSITLSNLDTNTQYYVKYAFISAIDPTTYTISSELTATVLDENVKVYGYLTKDSANIPTSATGTSGVFTEANGIFKVYEYSYDWTGNGPAYGIVANSATGGLTATINATTGVYSATALTSDTGSITFYATYDNITIQKTWTVTKAKAGSSSPLLNITATGNAFVFADQNASTAQTTSLTITSNLSQITGTPTYTAVAYKNDGTVLGYTPFTTNNDNSITITGSQFNYSDYNNLVSYVIVTSSLSNLSDSITIYRINNGSEQIIVQLSNESHTIAAATDGTVVAANYTGSGTVIKVLQGATYLPVDNVAPYATGTWTVSTITSNGITADTTPTIGSDYIDFDTHAAMTADVAYIDYTITGTSTTGKAFSIVKRQSFSKSKTGTAGNDAPIVVLTTDYQIFVQAKNTTTLSPTTANLTATVTNLTSPTYAWYINGVLQTSATTNTLSVASFSGSPKLIKVIATSGSKSTYDQLTLYSVKEGDDTFQAGLVNENQTITADSSGNVVSGQLPLSSHLDAMRGSTILFPPDVTFSKVSETGLTSTINTTTGDISITAITAAASTNSMQATYRVTLNSSGAYLDKQLTVNKSLGGATGATGAVGAAAKYVNLTFGTLSFTYLTDGTTPSPSNTTVTATAQNTSGTVYYEFLEGSTSKQNTTTNTYTFTPPAAFSSMPILITVKIREGSSTGTVVATDTFSLTATKPSTQTTTVNLYQWSTTTPATPTGTSTYTWATATNATYTAADNWTTTISANPGTPGIKLWQASVNISAANTATNTSVNYTSATISAVSQNGAAGTPGTQSATPTVYQWAATIPAGPTGTSTWTWSTSTISAAPASWSLTPGTSPSVGYTLWAARYTITDVATVSTTSIPWTSASVSAVGYAGTNGNQGASYRVGYARIANNPVAVTATVTTTGNSTFPTTTDTAWGASFAVTWYGNDPTPSSTSSLYQIDGVYNPATGNTVWSAPYISSLKVGSLSAVNTNTGALTVSGALTVGTSGTIQSGKTSFSDTTAGYFLEYNAGTPRISIGNSSNSLTWNGTSLAITGTVNISGGSGYANLTDKPANLAALDSTANTKLSGIAAGATVNNVTYSSTAPTTPVNGDIWVDTSVTPNITKVRVSGVWQNGATNTTNTSQLTDGANLGGTAAWTGVTSRPTELTDGRVSTALNSSGSLISSVAGTASINGILASTVTTNAAAVTTKLNKDTADTLSGFIALSTTGAIKVGTATIDTTTRVVSGSGIIISSTGISGVKAGVATFSIDSSGNAIFKGDITTSGKAVITGAQTGTNDFNTTTVGLDVNNTGASSIGGLFYTTATSFGVGVCGYTSVAATGACGVLGMTANSTGAGVYAGVSGNAGAGATALYVQGPMKINNSTLVTNLNAEYLNGQLSSYYATATATNLASTTANAALPKTGGTMTGLLIGRTNNISDFYASNDSGSFSVRGDVSGTTKYGAVMSFHIPNSYAINIGLDWSDNWFKIGGWSGTSGAYVGVQNGALRATGAITASYSDRRLKTNIRPITNAISKVTSLNGVIYNSNNIAAEYGYDIVSDIVGLFADEVEAVLPEAVHPAPFDHGPDDTSITGQYYKTIQYEKIIPLLVEAIKEQQLQIISLTNLLSDKK